MPEVPRRLVVNADDLGFAREVNEGILEAHSRGIVRAASLLATGPAFQHAVALARRTPTLEVGVHLALVGLPSALDGRPLPPTLPALLRQLALGRLPVRQELAAQVLRVLEAGIQPTHLDTHKHTHLIRPVLEAVGSLARQFGIRWIRRPFDFPRPAAPWPERVRARAWLLLAGGFDRRLARFGCRTTDHFAGLRLTGRFGPAELVRLITELPPGSTEFMCHPGRCGPELMAARTRLKQSRERELAALTAPEVFQALRRAEIALAGFRELDGPSTAKPPWPCL